jgi:hypothetical protein
MPDNVGDVPDATEPYGYPDMRTTHRNAVTLTGNQLGQPMVFAHGYGGDQNTLDSNYLGWSSQMAPVIMGNPDRPELGPDLSAPEEAVDAIKAWL